MSKLFQHLCPACASHLVLDTDKSVFNCPSCGGTFDYDYFMEDNLIDQAEESLKSGEYVSAKSAYEFLLTKEPHNAMALRGLELCNLRISSFGVLTSSSNRKYKNFDFDFYVRESEDKYKEFFKSIPVVNDKANKLNDYKAKIDDCNTEKTRAERELGRIKYVMAEGWNDEVLFHDKYGKEVTAHTMFIYFCLCLALTIVSIIVFAVSKFMIEWFVTSFILALITLVCFVMSFPATSQMREAKRKLTEVNQRVENAKEALSKAEQEYKDKQQELRTYFLHVKELEKEILTDYGAMKGTEE
ncbi:MAG: hypothetical protein MJ172_06575 [Clostridia bacterium]|nr:hypothetical protein [Clostridia bacterium]